MDKIRRDTTSYVHSIHSAIHTPASLLIQSPQISRLDQVAFSVLFAIDLLPSLLPILPIPSILIPTPPLLPGPLIKFIQHLLRDTIEQLLGVDPQQTPRQIDTLIDGPALIRALVDERPLELVQELQGQLVFGGKGFLADDGLHAGGVAADGIFGVKLVGDVAVVFPRVTFADDGFHEAGEGWEDVDWGVDALVVELTVDEDLAFGDVAGQIGNGVGDV